MQEQNQSDHKYVFVCGMPRSGTSVLGRNLGRLENCTDFKNTGVIEDEGQFLQDVYPVTSKLGGAGSFGFDPRAHRTEYSDLLTPENIARLRESWHAHWDNSKSIYVEKTPGNLLMTRFLQAAFPNAYFVVIKRHPVPVAMAMQKWKIDVVSLNTAVKHWLHCHDLFEEDKLHLKCLYELRYEDYVEDAERYHQEIAEFIGTRVVEAPAADNERTVTQWRPPSRLVVKEGSMEATTNVHNPKYFNRWSALLKHPVLKRYYRHIAANYESRVAKHGYSLIEGFGVPELMAAGENDRSNVIDSLYCRGADLSAFACRAWIQSVYHVKRTLRAGRAKIMPSRRRGLSENADTDSLRPGQVRQGGRFSS